MTPRFERVLSEVKGPGAHNFTCPKPETLNPKPSGPSASSEHEPAFVPGAFKHSLRPGKFERELMRSDGTQIANEAMMHGTTRLLQISTQCLTNSLWAVAKLVLKGQEAKDLCNEFP